MYLFVKVFFFVFRTCQWYICGVIDVCLRRLGHVGVVLMMSKLERHGVEVPIFKVFVVFNFH